MSEIKKTHVAYLHETTRESWARDLGTFAMIIALWSIGHWAESAALEWIGVFMAFVIVVSRAVSRVKGAVDNRMTPDEARAWLDEHFPPDPSRRPRAGRRA